MLQENIAHKLSESALRLDAAQLSDYAQEFRRLAEQTSEPCVVAVAGRVKAGKSSFINALLGEDLAKVGNLETTATINYFRYGTPNPEKPVRCYWQDGSCTEEDRDFLDGLQGNDEATLKRACGIHHLEYLQVNAFLRETTLVDTPGTGALVDAHQSRTDNFLLRTQQQLREQHSQDTRKLSHDADAVIYLMGAAAGVQDKHFLEDFKKDTSGNAQALNTIGIIAKIDTSPEFLEQRQAHASHIAEQLHNELNTVLPVSAGLFRILHHFTPTELIHFIETVQRFPAEELDFAISSDEIFYADDEFVPLVERKALAAGMPWGVFTTLARAAAKCSSAEDMAARVGDVAGFEQLKQVLETHFFHRGHILRSFRILRDAQTILQKIRYRELPANEKKAREHQSKLDSYLAYVKGLKDTSSTARELAGFLAQERERVSTPPRAQLEDVDRLISTQLSALEEYNQDFEALQQLQEQQNESEYHEELAALFGLYGLENAVRVPKKILADTDLLGERQLFWRGMALRAQDPVHRSIASRADARYGLILNDLFNPET